MSQVKLILTESVHSLGEAGDLVTVKPGYARNFLLAQGKAMLATETRVKEFEHHQRILAEKVAKEMKDFEVAKKHLEGVTLEVSALAGAEGKLFGSVTSARIGELLAEKGFEIDRRRITLSDPIRALGEHAVPIKLHRDVVATVKLIVTADETAVASPDGEDEDPDDRADRAEAELDRENEDETDAS